MLSNVGKLFGEFLFTYHDVAQDNWGKVEEKKSLFKDVTINGILNTGLF